MSQSQAPTEGASRGSRCEKAERLGQRGADKTAPNDGGDGEANEDSDEESYELPDEDSDEEV